MARRRSDQLEDRIHAVVRGRERVTLEVLVELIDAVNPTGRGLSRAEQDERYRQKSRLQSVLIREHGELVRVERVDDVTVSLRLDGTGRHAAHARIDSLDDDARSWMQRQLDAPDDAEATVWPTNAARGVETAEARSGDLAAGDAALEAYDYETARSSYERAASGSIAGTRRLLSLLVDVLVDDAAAIAHGARLDDDVRGDAVVRAAVATAEARSGSVPRARSLLLGVDVPAAGAAWVELGARALRDDDADSAADAARRARALDAGLATLRALEAELEQHTRKAEARAESELEAALASGANDDVVLALATHILARHPTSRSAAAERRRIERARGAHAVDARLTAARGLAETATSLPEHETALAALRAAQAVGAQLHPDEVEVVARKVAALRLEAATSELVAELRVPGEAGLLAFLAAPTAVRDAARARVAMPVLDWLVELAAPATGARAKAAVRAVLDLDHAHARARDGRHAEARDLLAAHPALRDVEAARRLRDAIADVLGTRARAQLEHVLAAIERRDLQAAVDSWNALDRASLGPDDEAAADRAQIAISRHVVQLERMKDFKESLRALELRRARFVAREMQEFADPAERAGLEEMLGDFDSVVAQRHALVVVEGAAEALDGRDVDPHTEIPEVGVDDATGRAVLATFYDEHAFLRVLDLGGSSVTRSIVLRSLVGTLERALVEARAEHIEITTRSGARILVDWHGKTVIDVVAPPRVALDADVQRAILHHDDDTTWVMGFSDTERAKPFTRVIDRKTGRIRRTVTGQRAYGSFMTRRGRETWGIGENQFVRVDAEAVPFGTMTSLPGKILSLRPSFDDEGVFVLACDRELQIALPPTLRRFGPDGETRGELRLDGARSTIWCELMTVAGGCFVRTTSDAGLARVIAVREREGRLEVAWQLDLSCAAVLADSNVLGTSAVLLGSPITIHRLSLEHAPRVPSGPAETYEEVAPSAAIFIGQRRQPGVTPLVTRVLAEVLGATDAELDARVGQLLGRKAEVETVWAEAIAVGGRRPDLGQRLFAHALARAPLRVTLALDAARHALARLQFDDAVAILAPVATANPRDGAVRALLAAARYGTGQVELARSEIREVVATLAPNDPERAACAAFATFLDAVCGPDRHATLVGRRAQVLAEALALRDAGDLRAAIARVDVAWVWRPREQTAMDVLAELWAALDPATEEERVRQRLVLAAQRAHDPERLAPLVLPGRPYRPPVLAPVIDDAPSDSR